MNNYNNVHVYNIMSKISCLSIVLAEINQLEVKRQCSLAEGQWFG